MKIIDFLSQEDRLSVNELKEKLDITQSMTSQHLAQLRNAGILDNVKEANICYYYILNKNLLATTDLESFCRKHKYIFLAIPPSSVLSVVDKMQDILEGDQVLIYTLRFLFGKEAIPLSKYIWENTLVRKVAYLTGPVFEEEILAKNPVSLLIASPFKQIREDILKMLAFPWIRIYSHEDMNAVEWSSALANIGLLIAGLATGMGFGSSTISFLVSRMVNEISTILKYKGFDGRISEGMAGMGTIFAGVHKGKDFFFQWGKQMGMYGDPKKAVKGLKYSEIGNELLTTLYQWSKNHKVYMPITTGMYRVFVENEDISLVQEWLLSQPAKPEFTG